jgi:hypothetical protein
MEWMLLSKAQLIDDHSISVHFGLFQVVEKPSPLSHQFKQTPPGVMIPFVNLKMLCEIPDPFAEQGNLNLR